MASICLTVILIYSLSHHFRKKPQKVINSFLGSSNFCRLLLSIADSLVPDQDRQNVGPDLDPNHGSGSVFLKQIFEIVNFEKKSRRQQNHEKLPSMERVNFPKKISMNLAN